MKDPISSSVVRAQFGVTRLSYLLIQRGYDSILPRCIKMPSFAPWIATSFGKISRFTQVAVIPHAWMYSRRKEFRWQQLEVAKDVFQVITEVDPHLMDFYLYRWFSQHPKEVYQQLVEQSGLKDTSLVYAVWNSQYHSYHPSEPEKSPITREWAEKASALTLEHGDNGIIRWYLPLLYLFLTM